MNSERVTARPTPQLSVIVVSWNTRELLRDCLASLGDHLTAVPHEVIVVDNASVDGSPDMVATDFPDVRLIRNRDNVGFGAANNQAMRVALGRWFLLLNSDAQLINGSVAQLFTKVTSTAGIGVAQCRLLLPDGRVQPTTHRFPSLGLTLFEVLRLYKFDSRRGARVLLRGYWDHDEERDVDWVIGAFMLLPREVFDQTGGFDERLFMYGEDREWCYRIHQLGWRIRFYPEASVAHIRHASASIRYGDDNILSLCLQRDRDFYFENHGRTHGWLLLAIRLLGTAAQGGYYAVRSIGGKRAGSYRAMRPELITTTRILFELAIGRR